MEKIEQINIGDTQWELNDALEKYKPDTMAKVLDKLVEVIEKQGEIIDRLNQQPEEGWYCECGEPANEGEHICDEEYKKVVEDTPEQKEEWEFDLRNLMYRDGEQLRCAGEGKPYTGEYRELVVSMIKNLLSERERELLEDIVNKNTYEQGVDYEDIAIDVIERLDKLTISNMEKKKKEFFKTMNTYHKRLKEYVKSGDLEKDQNPDEWLWERIEQELDKAREEGIVDYYSVDELYAIEDAFHLVLRNGGEWDDIGESAREKNWELIKLTTK